MTLCIATLCEDRKTIVLGADKMIGTGFIEAELEIEKTATIHPDWWVQFSGTVPYVFDILDQARSRLRERDHWGVEDVELILEQCYHEKRLRVQEATYLIPRGWRNWEQFQEQGPSQLGQPIYATFITDMALNFRFDLQLLVAGFDTEGEGHIFTIVNPGTADRSDIPGYHAIGNGMFGALYFLYYREISTKMTAAEALYHVFEAKIFGYQAGSIGTETDFVILRLGQPPIHLQESSTELRKALNSLWRRFSPRPVQGLEQALGRFVSSVVESNEDSQGTQPPQPGAQ